METKQKSEYKIKDYWCFGCGLVSGTSFVCPVCGSIDYGVIEFDLADNPKKELLMELYHNNSLYVHSENGRLVLRDRSVGKVEKVKTLR